MYPCRAGLISTEPCLRLTKSRGTGSMEAAGNTTRVVYVCSVCDKAFGDIHSSCAKHVNGRGACKAKEAVVLQLPINFSRNDRNVRGRLGRHGLGGLEAPGPKRVTWILYAAGLRRLPGHPCQVSILIPYHHPYLSYILIPIILHTYLNYPRYLSQLSYISCHLSHLSATCLCSG